MKIRTLQIDGFGIWTNLRIERVPGNLTVFYGANEAGKTTLMQFLRAMLYGFSDERRASYLPPLHGGAAGGWLEVVAGHTTLQIARHDQTQVGQTSFELRNDEGAPVGKPLACDGLIEVAADPAHAAAVADQPADGDRRAPRRLRRRA